MPNNNLIANHYANRRLLDAIQYGLQEMGKTPSSVTVEDLGPVDEFHIGGRAATETFLDQLDLSVEHRVLDVGCGLGGASRFAAKRYGCSITGIDLTPEYIEAGEVLCSWVGMEDRIRLTTGDATATAFPDASFDRAYMLHVGMNIFEKTSLACELYRVLRPGGMLGIYDVMRMKEGEIEFPVPWATDADGSALGTPQEYAAALEAAGFRVISERNRRDYALEFFAEMQAKAANAGRPPPLGLHILMGDSTAEKLNNMVNNISAGLLAPVEFIAEKVA